VSDAGERFAVIGATGAVGLELLGLLARAGVPAENVTALASARSAGAELLYGDAKVTARALAEGAEQGHTIALFAASSWIAKEWAPRFVEAGSVVIDNSSGHRMADGVPLVVPEVNGDRVRGDRSPRIIANPNCSTIIMLVAANPLRAAFGCRRLIVSTYQAASGAGIAAMRELEANAVRALRGEEQVCDALHEPAAFNVFSHDSAVDSETGLNVEETKMIEETRKIWNDPGVDVRPTCIRTSVMRAHSESMHIELDRSASEADVRAALSGAPGVRILDDRAANRFPTPLKSARGHDVLIGRIRAGGPLDGDGRSREWELFASGDQLLKGAALNAWQIAALVLA